MLGRLDPGTVLGHHGDLPLRVVGPIGEVDGDHAVSRHGWRGEPQPEWARRWFIGHGRGTLYSPSGNTPCAPGSGSVLTLMNKLPSVTCGLATIASGYVGGQDDPMKGWDRLEQLTAELPDLAHITVLQ